MAGVGDPLSNMDHASTVPIKENGITKENGKVKGKRIQGKENEKERAKSGGESEGER